MTLARRRYREDIDLSIIGFGGMVAVSMTQAKVDEVVAESIADGLNYFDVAPFYGDGEAEGKLGRALEPYRKGIFLASKTLERTAAGARADLERSLSRLRTAHLDLYQFHAVTTLEEVDRIMASGGAVEAFVEARAAGKIRFIGFSAHSVEAALAMMDRFRFDSLLFPVNFICYAKGGFGPQVLKRAQELGVARLAIKSMAHGRWHKEDRRRFPKCWYRPITDRVQTRDALRFTLSEDVTAVVPPGDARLFRMALELAEDLPPLSPEERNVLLEAARGVRPLFRCRKTVQ